MYRRKSHPPFQLIQWGHYTFGHLPFSSIVCVGGWVGCVCVCECVCVCVCAWFRPPSSYNIKVPSIKSSVFAHLWKCVVVLSKGRERERETGQCVCVSWTVCVCVCVWLCVCVGARKMGSCAVVCVGDKKFAAGILKSLWRQKFKLSRCCCCTLPTSHTTGVPEPQSQSCALEVFFNFFSTIEMIFSHFYQVGSQFLHQSHYESSLQVKLTC